MKRFILLLSCLINITVMVVAMDNKQQLKEIIAEMKKNNIYTADRDASNYKQIYDNAFEAEKKLRKILPKIEFNKEVLDSIVNITWTLVQNYSLASDIVRSLPNEEAVIQYTNRLIDEMKPENEKKHANVRRAMGNASYYWSNAKSRNPKIPKLCIKYYMTLKEKLGYSVWKDDRTTRFLAKDFAQNEDFIQFAWQHFHEKYENDHDKRSIEDALINYKGPRSQEFLLDAFGSKESETLKISIRTAEMKLKTASNEEKAQIIDGLKKIILTNFKNESVWRNALEVLEKALPHEKAISAFLEIHLEKGEEAFWAGNILSDLVEKDTSVLTTEHWNILIEKIKEDPKKYKVTGILTSADLSSKIPEVMELMEVLEGNDLYDFMNGVVYQKQDTLIEILHNIKNSKPDVKIGIISAFSGRDVPRNILYEISDYLKDRDPYVVQQTFLVLHESKDPKIVTKLEKVPQKKLKGLSDLYFVLTNCLRLYWEPEKRQFTAGNKYNIALTFKNEGYLPIVFPSSNKKKVFINDYNHDSEWKILIDGETYLGPIEFEDDPLKISKDKKVKTKVLNRNQKFEKTLDIGDILSVLEPGKHKIAIAYVSRSRQRHWQRHPDFIVETPNITIEIVKPDQWQKSKTGIIAMINSSNEALRKEGWGQLKTSDLKFNKSGELYKLLEKFADGKYNTRKYSFNLNVSGHDIRKEKYNISNFHGKQPTFRWDWDEEDIRGGSELKLSYKEADEFFKFLFEAPPFDYEPIQKYGTSYELKASVSIGIFEKENDLDGVGGSSKAIWLFELKNNPKLSPWFNKLTEWKSKSGGDLE